MKGLDQYHEQTSKFGFDSLKVMDSAGKMVIAYQDFLDLISVIKKCESWQNEDWHESMSQWSGW